MERKLGEIFTYKGKTYQVIETNACRDCAFKIQLCEVLKSITGTCIPGERTDHTSVSFKLINNMENNQLTIDIPEGMKIDLENSDLAKGIVKFKKKYITYDDILQECSTNFGGLRVRNHCINKIIAISQLMNIAKYYNKDWNPNWRSLEESKCYIYYRIRSNTYGVANTSSTNYGYIYFRSYKDAQEVIDNPNFRDILDAIYKN